MRRYLWLLLFGSLVAGCVIAPDGEPDGEQIWPDVIENEDLHGKTALELLDAIQAKVNDPEDDLHKRAEHRKRNRFAEYTNRVGWLRVAIALRYVEEGEKLPAKSAEYRSLALYELTEGGTAPDEGWAEQMLMPDRTARWYLECIKEKVVEPPGNGGDPNGPRREEIIERCDRLLEAHLATDQRLAKYPVPLGDEVAWARVVCAYYAGWFDHDWELARSELDHIDD